jgi:parallel beta-helix repeat protein
MKRSTCRAVLMLLGLLSLAGPGRVVAAESYGNCTGFIASLPSVISTQGTWCLKQNLGIAVSNGIGITIATNNVTVDCNGYTLSGTAGAATATGGIYAANRVNATVRHCNFQGFYYGLFFTGTGGSGHLVEDNRFVSNTAYGMDVQGDGSVLRRNLVYNTGPSSQSPHAYGIVARDSVEVLDNTVVGVTTITGSNGYLYGIYVLDNGDGRINGNRVRGLVPDGSGNATAIAASASANVSIRDNELVGNGGLGIVCDAGSGAIVRDNTVLGFAAAVTSCDSNASNYAAP